MARIVKPERGQLLRVRVDAKLGEMMLVQLFMQVDDTYKGIVLHRGKKLLTAKNLRELFDTLDLIDALDSLRKNEADASVSAKGVRAMGKGRAIPAPSQPEVSK